MKAIFVLAVIFSVAHAAENAQKIAARTEVKAVEDIQSYLLSYPNAKPLEFSFGINQRSLNARYNQNWYTLGSRVNGDRLIATDSGSAAYPSKQNLELKIWYPTAGVGAVVSYVQVLITQDNGTAGRGYVVAGGIGQRYIQIVVEAWNTAYIRYDYSFYGV